MKLRSIILSISIKRICVFARKKKLHWFVIFYILLSDTNNCWQENKNQINRQWGRDENPNHDTPVISVTFLPINRLIIAHLFSRIPRHNQYISNFRRPYTDGKFPLLLAVRMGDVSFLKNSIILKLKITPKEWHYIEKKKQICPDKGYKL